MNRAELLSKAKPILFNTLMVQAILDDRKTATRRVIKPQPEMSLAYIYAGQNNGSWSYSPYDKENFEEYKYFPKYWTPPCHTDDILYVRETWCKTDCFGLQNGYVYKADGDKNDIFKHTGFTPIWRPSIHMPKEAARIFLRVTNVRAERLQDITEEQAIQEGISHYTKDNSLYKYAVSLDWWEHFHKKHKKQFKGDFWQDMPLTAKEAFAYLWNSTLPKDSLEYFYINNPWVWVIEFERLEVLE